MWWKVTTPSGIMMVHAFDLTKVKAEFEVLEQESKAEESAA
jgi:hypothetical protein